MSSSNDISPVRLGYKYRLNPKKLTPEQKRVLRKIDLDAEKTSPRRKVINKLNFDISQPSTSAQSAHLEYHDEEYPFDSTAHENNNTTRTLIVGEDTGLSPGFKSLMQKLKNKVNDRLVLESHNQPQEEENIEEQNHQNNVQIRWSYQIQFFWIIALFILMMFLIFTLLSFVNKVYKHTEFVDDTKSRDVNIISGNVFNYNPPLSQNFESTNGINEYIEEYLSKYDADKTLRSDFALESLGGKILSIGQTVPFHSKSSSPLSRLWSFLCSDVESARKIIQVNTAPGECWAFDGSHGEVIVKLIGFVYISDVSLEHIPASISPTQEISSAPRKFKIYGLKNMNDEGSLLGSFEYDKTGKPLQFFKTGNETKEPFNMIKMVIDTNWGNMMYTCVYRIRVHGILADISA